MPWQRVINAQGRVSIRNLRHAAEEQQALLEAEGVEFDRRGFIDWQRFGWDGLSAGRAGGAAGCAVMDSSETGLFRKNPVSSDPLTARAIC